MLYSKVIKKVNAEDLRCPICGRPFVPDDVINWTDQYLPKGLIISINFWCRSDGRVRLDVDEDFEIV